MKIKTTDLILFLILFFALVESMSSCTVSKIAHTPSKREIKRAMKYSTSDYKLPYMETHLMQVYDPSK